jgi:hypothetical protein
LMKILNDTPNGLFLIESRNDDGNAGVLGIHDLNFIQNIFSV